MKRLLIIISFCIFGVLQTVAQDQKAADPDEQIIVNKEFDENGNLIRFDSTYVRQWSSDSTIHFPFGNGFPGAIDPSMIDSMLQQFGMSHSFGFSPFNDDDFWDSFGSMHSDSAFINPFDQQTLLDEFFNAPGFEEIQKRMQEQLEQFNQFSPQFQNEGQRKEWEELMERQRKEQEEFLKRL